MQHIDSRNARSSRLRFVFDDTVVSLTLAGNSNLEDIAWTLGELSPRYGKPLAVDITLSEAAHAARLEG